MRFQIQLFRSIDGEIGYWTNTAWRGDDRTTVMERAMEIAKTIGKKHRDITQVRVVEVLGSWKTELRA